MIEIDPNVRIENDHTFTRCRDTADLRAGDAHVVIEPECGVTWPASIVSVDHATGFVVLDVAWAKGKVGRDGHR